MNAIMVFELLSGNYFLEKTGLEITQDDFAFLRKLSPDQMWIVCPLLKHENVTNPNFDWKSHNQYQQQFEANLKNQWKH